jgi:hypothetical protein
VLVLALPPPCGKTGDMADELPERPKRKFKLYYSKRLEKRGSDKLTLQEALDFFALLYGDFQRFGYFAEAFGQDCPDGDLAGYLGPDWKVQNEIALTLGKKDLWPFGSKYPQYALDDFFDVLEFLYDHVSRPVDGDYHGFGDCGYHYNAFDTDSGRQEFRDEANEILLKLGDGYSISSTGQIVYWESEAMRKLAATPLPPLDPTNVEQKVNSAVERFGRYRSSVDDRREAVRTLVDVLEFLRPQLKGILKSKDDDDLFNIANNFGIRHHRSDQRTEYDKVIWLSWMFHFYLATIHAVCRLLERSRLRSGTQAKTERA